MWCLNFPCHLLSPTPMSFPSAFLSLSGSWSSPCVFHTLVQACVFRLQALNMKLDCAFRSVHGVDKLIWEAMSICWFPHVSVDPAHPLKSLSWCLFHQFIAWLVKVYLENLQGTFSEDPGFLTSIPDCTSVTWIWTPVERRQKSVQLALFPSSGQRLSVPLPVVTAIRKDGLQV